MLKGRTMNKRTIAIGSLYVVILLIIGHFLTPSHAQVRSRRPSSLTDRVKKLEQTIIVMEKRILALEKKKVVNSTNRRRAKQISVRSPKTPPAPPAVVGTGRSPIESRIDGTFEGWDGETIFKLKNGQIWQQASYSYHYHYAYQPKVLIYKSSGGWKMKVGNIKQSITVKQIK
jgi:hypothetical protein